MSTNSYNENTNSPLNDDEKMEVYRVTRNFQDSPKTVLKKITEIVGKDRVQLALDYLKTVAA
jgi:hypothetical protein